MARNKFDVDETLESPFSFKHLKRAMKYVRRHSFQMLLALVLSGIASVVALFGPKIMQYTLDDVVPNKDFKMLGIMAAVYTVIVLIGIVFTTIRARIMAFVSQEIVYDIREDLFAHLQKLPFSYYDSRPAGKILVRVINYVNSVSDMLSNGIINSILEIINIIFIVVFMYTTNAGARHRDRRRSAAVCDRSDAHQAASAQILAAAVQQKLQLQCLSGGEHRWRAGQPAVCPAGGEHQHHEPAR